MIRFFREPIYPYGNITVRGKLLVGHIYTNANGVHFFRESFKGYFTEKRFDITSLNEEILYILSLMNTKNSTFKFEVKYGDKSNSYEFSIKEGIAYLNEMQEVINRMEELKVNLKLLQQAEDKVMKKNGELSNHILN